MVVCGHHLEEEDLESSIFFVPWTLKVVFIIDYYNHLIQLAPHLGPYSSN